MNSLEKYNFLQSIEHHEYSGVWAVIQLIGASKYLTWFGNGIGLINFIILVVCRIIVEKQNCIETCILD